MRLRIILIIKTKVCLATMSKGFQYFGSISKSYSRIVVQLEEVNMY